MDRRASRDATAARGPISAQRQGRDKNRPKPNARSIREKAAQPPVAALPKETAPPPEALRVTMAENKGCKFPLWGAETPPDEFRYCGLPRSGAAYCPHHSAVAYTKVAAYRADNPSIPAGNRRKFYG